MGHDVESPEIIRREHNVTLYFKWRIGRMKNTYRSTRRRRVHSRVLLYDELKDLNTGSSKPAEKLSNTWYGWQT